MTAKRLTAFLLVMIAIAFWLSVGIYGTTGAFMIALKSAGLNPHWAVLFGLPITLAGLFLSIRALRRWSN